MEKQQTSHTVGHLRTLGLSNCATVHCHWGDNSLFLPCKKSELSGNLFNSIRSCKHHRCHESHVIRYLLLRFHLHVGFFHCMFVFVGAIVLQLLLPICQLSLQLHYTSDCPLWSGFRYKCLLSMRMLFFDLQYLFILSNLPRVSPFVHSV